MKRLLFLPALIALLGACTEKQYEDCPAKQIVDDWGVTRTTHTFGEFDSLYYLVNPIGNVQDSLYFNGNYTDSYYKADSMRVMLRFTLTDSIWFNMDRMYAVETNPEHLIMTLRQEADSIKRECTLRLRKIANSENLYRCGPDSIFSLMLRSERMILATATNATASGEPQGSQNYEFFLNPAGFSMAFAMADSLNNPGKFKAEEKTDSTKSHKKHKKFKL